MPRSASSSSLVQVPETATTPAMENRGKVLKGITIRCLLEDSAQLVLGALTLAITRGPGEDEDNVKLERVSPTTWNCNSMVELQALHLRKQGMSEIAFVIRAEPTEVLGYVTLAEDDIERLIAATEDMSPIEWNIKPAEPTCPSLWMKITVDEGPILSNLTDEKPAPGLLEKFDELAGRMGGTDMALDFLANQSGGPQLLSTYGNLFLERFQVTEKEVDFNNAISAYELATMSTDDENYGAYTWAAGVAWLKRFQTFGNIHDIDQAVSLLEISVSLTPESNANMMGRLNDLGISFESRFNRTGDLADIENAISNKQRAVELTPPGHVDLPSHLNNLGISFQSRFKRTGDPADIENAISNQQRAVELTPPGHADLPARLSNLGNSFQLRFGRTGDLTDIESAISNQQRAIELTPLGHASLPSSLNDLGGSFNVRFGRTRDPADMENAISNKQRAIELTPPGHAILSSWLNNLGNLFRSRFGRTGDLRDIESTIFYQQRAVKLSPPGHADLPARLSNLGASFESRFRRTGDLADIENTISNKQRAVELTPPGHDNLPSYLNNLGISFQSRFKRTGDLADIENAISNQHRATELTPPGHPILPLLLNNLGTSFQSCFERTADLADIENAISNQQRSVELTPPGHPGLPAHLSNLGTSFRFHFERTEDLADIDSAISNFQHAVKLTPLGHARLPFYLNNLGISFQSRFKQTGDLADMENATSNKQRAVELTPPSHVDQTISTFRASATQIIGSPSVRLKAAKRWAELSPSDTLEAFGVGIELLSHVAALEQCHSNIIDESNLIASATAAAINAGKLNTALEWLEQGRRLVWNQIQHLRTPVDQLRAYNPALADRFVKVGNALEASGSRPKSFNIFSEETMSRMIDAQRESQMHVELAQDWTRLLEEIHALPDFQDFLRPPKAASLFSGLPPNGAVIIFNIHEDKCDALALVSGTDTPLYIPLPNFSMQQAVQLRDDLRTYLKGEGMGMRETHLLGRPAAFSKEATMHRVLRDIWEHLAKPVLDALGYNLSRQSSRPHLWWCPTGPLAHLPIHAAGIYTERSHAGPCVSDFVVSSYTPTVSALIERTKSIPQISNETPTRLLLVSQPTTPGLPYIPAARTETHTLKQMMEKNNIPSVLIEDAAATATRVTEEIVTHNWVHFSCHGIQDQEPLKSGLHLHDSRLELLQMMKQRIPDADHCFLSACQIGTGDKQLADEAVHIAAGMLALGYRGVIATLWSISDNHGPEITQCFYQYMLDVRPGGTGQRLDSTQAAYALDHSIQKIREKLGDGEAALAIWVPYVHSGI